MHSGDGVGAAEGKLLQHVLLKRRSRYCDGRVDRQRDAHPFAVEEEEQLVVDDRPTHAAAEVVDVGKWLVIARRRVGEVIGRVHHRSIPQLVQVAVKLVRS